MHINIDVTMAEKQVASTTVSLKAQLILLHAMHTNDCSGSLHYMPQGRTMLLACHCFQMADLSLLSDGSNPVFRKAEVQIGIDMIAALIRLYALKVLPNLDHTSLPLAQHVIGIAPKLSAMQQLYLHKGGLYHWYR